MGVLTASRKGRTTPRRWRRGMVAVAAGVVLLGCQATAEGGRGTKPAPSASLAAPSEVAFSLAMLHTLADGGRTNLVISPTSLASGLAMLELGSQGATEAGIAHALQASHITADALSSSIGALRRALLAAGGITLNEADAVFTRTGFMPRRSYLGVLRSDFATSLHPVSFATDPAQAVAAINHFVSVATRGRLPSLFSSPLDPATLLVLVDAVYLNAKWSTPFPHAGTAPGAFHLASGATVQVRFMRLASDEVRTESGSGLTALSLPYEGERFEALFLEPTTTSLATFIANLTPTRLTSVLSALRPQDDGVALPTVDVATDAGLDAPLSDLGMEAAFSDSANFSRIVAAPRLRVTTVRQVATLQIDEAGTVAAAATGIGLAPTAVAAPRHVVRIDHPFVVLIRDRRTGAVLFAGVVADPAQGANH